MRVRRALVAVTTAVVGGVLLPPALDAAAQDLDGPGISLSVGEVRPSESVLVTITGFESNAVTLSVCGNAARRGSIDCHLSGSEGQHLRPPPEPTVSVLPVSAPPTPCPCVVVASTKTFDQVAVAPLEILGHPTGPIVGSPEPDPLEVRVEARRDPDSIIGALRSSLGGPTRYAVTVTVRNRSTEVLHDVDIGGAATKAGGDVVTDLAFRAIEALPPGQTWTSTAHTTMSAPVLGDYRWEVSAIGGGPNVAATTTTRARPFGLAILVALLLVDVVVMMARRSARRRAIRTARRSPFRRWSSSVQPRATGPS